MTSLRNSTMKMKSIAMKNTVPHLTFRIACLAVLTLAFAFTPAARAANGTWSVYSLDHDLESLVPGGAWFSNVGAIRPGLGPVVS